jgi:hypothetical protein
MLGENIRPETIMVQFRFPGALGMLENIINVVSVIARDLICINLKSVGLQEKDAAGTRTLEPSQYYPQAMKTKKGAS